MNYNWNNILPRGMRTGQDIVTRVVRSKPRLARHWLSCDLGQAADYTALVVGQTYVEEEQVLQHRRIFETRETLAAEKTIYSFRVLNAHRPRLGTSYPIIAAQIAAFLEDLPNPDLLVDATGVGRGVIDILRSRDMKPIAITITNGIEVNKVSEWDIRTPKVELVSALMASSQEDRVHIAPELPLRDVLTREIAAFGPRMTATGNMAFEGRDGVHDDLVLSLAIAVWHQSQPRPRPAQFLNIPWMDR